MLSRDARPEGQGECSSSRTTLDRMGEPLRKPRILRTNAGLGRQIPTGDHSEVERQSPLEERGWFGNLQREVSCRLILEQTDLEDCADAYIAAARNSSMTGQNIQIGAYLIAKC